MSLPLRGLTDDASYTGRKLLQRALVLIQFSPVLKIADQSGAGITSFQENLRSAYPNLDMEMELLFQVDLQPGGGMAPRPAFQQVPVWRLSDTSRAWRVSLTRQSVSLEVTGEGYTNSDDYAQRMANVIRAVAEHFDPAERQRSGVRFINAARTGVAPDPIQDCASELVSITGDASVLQADLNWRLAVDEGELILRSGIQPPGSTHDPQVLEAWPERSWYLDIDVINGEVIPFDADVICEAILSQIRRVHAIYRWAMPNNGAR